MKNRGEAAGKERERDGPAPATEPGDRTRFVDSGVLNTAKTYAKIPFC